MKNAEELLRTSLWGQALTEAEMVRALAGTSERGAVMPSLATAAKLAAAFDLPLSGLLAHCEAREGETAH